MYTTLYLASKEYAFCSSTNEMFSGMFHILSTKYVSINLKRKKPYQLPFPTTTK
jgi:hypothetical protein